MPSVRRVIERNGKTYQVIQDSAPEGPALGSFRIVGPEGTVATFLVGGGPGAYSSYSESADPGFESWAPSFVGDLNEGKATIG
jgi:hypothetical protein